MPGGPPSEAIDFIQRNAERPWFAHVGFYAPHPPLNPPASQLKRYQGVDLPERSFLPGELDLMPERYQRAAERRGDITEEQWSEYRQHFYAMVSNVDVQIGRLLEALERTGVLEDTMIIFTSDHGDYLGDHGLNGKSILVYDQVYCVPLILRGKGVPKRGVVTELVELVDVMPTVLELLGLSSPVGVKGRSFLPVLEERGGGREYVYAENPSLRMIRTAEAKYAQHPGGEEILFDLRADPGEHRNLAQDPSARVLLEKMRRLMREKDFELWDDLPDRVAPY